jgi:hypothetical protein
MEYVTGQRQVIINFSEVFCKSEIEILNSACFKDIWTRYIKHIYKIHKSDAITVLEMLKKPEKEYITLFKLLHSFDIKTIKNMDKRFEKVLNHNDLLYDLIEGFYDYWRKFERYSVTYQKTIGAGVARTNFIEVQTQFNDLVLKTYRNISERVNGKKFAIYRQLPAGVNASLLITRNDWMGKESAYSFLYRSEVIENILIRPPFISYSDKNKRTGTYPEAKENPINRFKDNFKVNEYYCYCAHVGSSLAYVYFHRDYLAHGIALCNLFDFVPASECTGKKPDLLYIFGANYDGESEFYHDKENDIYVGVAPHDKSIDYFGYMKKMLLTLYNVKMIEEGNLPIHGACVSITMSDGKNKNIVIIGDSGAGKSESLEALANYAKDNISSQLTVFDDMGTFKNVNGDILAYGTEIGAFVRLDDMASGYAYREMDRAIFMNPDKINSRLVVPVARYPQIMKGYKLDMVLYANNYSDCEEEIEFFNNKDEALEVFIRGARCAKGTTQEIGLVESFFANPFGPVQREAQTREILDNYFGLLFERRVVVGQMYTRLAVPSMEQEGPAKAAKKLFELLEK